MRTAWPGGKGGEAGSVLVVVLDLVDLGGANVAAGHSDRTVVAAHGDAAGMVAGQHRGGEVGQLLQELVDVVRG